MQTEQGYTFGIDLGGTTVRTGLFAPDYTFIDSVTFRTRVGDGPNAVVADMAESIRDLQNKHRIAGRSIGIGSPGPLDLAAGRLLQLPNFPGWDDFPLRDELATATGCDVTLESDANVAALGELMMGAGRVHNVDSLVMWTLGTGVGGGIVLDKKVWRGKQDMAGELGHLSVNPVGKACSCGAQGCIEQYASATAIAAEGRAWFRKNDGELSQDALENMTTADMAKLADAGHDGMRAIFEDVGTKLGFIIAQVANTMDVPLYVVGGGVANAWHLFAPSLLSTVEKFSYVYRLGQKSSREPSPTIVPAVLGSEAGLLGASLIAKM